MPEYQYIFANALTKEKLGTLPLYGVSFSDFLNTTTVKPGNFTGTIRTDDRQYTAKQILDWTTPGQVQLWVERDKVLKWGGLVWSRTYQSDGRSLQISAQTFSSYPAVVQFQTNAFVSFGIPGTVASTAKDYNHLRFIWQYLRNETPTSTVSAYYDVGVTLEPFHTDSSPSSNFFFADNDRAYLQSYVNDILKLNAEFRIRATYDADGVTRIARFESNRKGVLGSQVDGASNYPVIRYPGTISKYWMTDSASTAAHKVTGYGSASGNATLTYTNADYVPGFIGMNLIKTYEVDTLTLLQSAVNSDLALAKPPIVNPVYEVSGNNIDMSWELGDFRRVVIDDPYRYPNGPVAGTVRIVGYRLTPASTQGIENLALVIDDESKLVIQGV